MDLSKYPAPHPQVAARVVDGSAVIVLADAGEVNVLNPVGTRVWELVDGAHSVREIASTIETEYGVSSQEARQDVEVFLQQLLDAQALTLQDHPTFKF